MRICLFQVLLYSVIHLVRMQMFYKKLAFLLTPDQYVTLRFTNKKKLCMY